jgi:putative DNA primase/helicase
MSDLHPDMIPAELRNLRQWVVWTYVGRDGKRAKIPFTCAGFTASSTSSATWSTFDKVLEAAPRFDGIGFVFTAADPYFGIDLDGCRDPESGSIEPWAKKILDDVLSYTEITPSGRGLHVIGIGKLPAGGRHKHPVEIYDKGRYFTMTGHHLASTPIAIEETSVDTDELIRRYFGGTEPTPSAPRPTQPVDMDDLDLLDKARHADNGSRFIALYDHGDFAGVGDGTHSAGDLSLCSRLAFWTGRDAARIDRLFRASALMRDKWDSSRGSETYGSQTIAKAIAECDEVYTPRTAERPECTPLPESYSLDSIPASGMNMADFLKYPVRPLEQIIDGILSTDGSGFLGGTEKTGKTYEALTEAVGIALGLPVLGHAVQEPRRVYFVAVEDSMRRVQSRVRAILRGYGLDPAAPEVQQALAERFVVRPAGRGVSLDDPEFIKTLHEVCQGYKPDVVYFDVLRKLTRGNLNDPTYASTICGIFDDLHERYGVVVRVVHHFRKPQGPKPFGGGSSEIAGSYVFGAWANDSLFFQRGRDGVTVVTFQSKDLAPLPPFTLKLYTEGPRHDPHLVRLVAEDVKPKAPASTPIDAKIITLMPTLATTTAHKGKPGISMETLIKATGAGENTVRRAVDRLVKVKRLVEVGTFAKGAKLYALDDSGG